jgi:hypothetical protein
MLRLLAARRAKAEVELRANAARHRDQVAAKLNLAGPHEFPVAVVPASTQSATLLPARRRRLFREHLAKLLTRLGETPAASRAPLPAEEQADAAQFHAEGAALNAACSTCRGYCCGYGGVEAFIDEPTLQRFAEAHPALDSDDILRAYISRLPKRSMKDSCVFHGEQGCALPRDMRSAVCNTYRCDGLQKLQEIHARQVLLTAAYEGRVVRSAVFSNGRIIATEQDEFDH